MSIRVLVVDDEGFIRRGVFAVLQSAPDLEVLGEAAGGHEALQKTVDLRPDVVLMDIVMPDGDGITATRAIKQRYPETKVLILTVCADSEVFRIAAEAGATGYVLKDISPEGLIGAIRSVYNGNAMLSPLVAKHIMDDLYTSRHQRAAALARQANGLTEREVDVLKGLAAGLSDKEIAADLYLSEATVKTHLRILYRRLKLRNRAQAAALAVEKGLLDHATAEGGRPVSVVDQRPPGKIASSGRPG